MVCSLALEELDPVAYDCLDVVRVPGSSSSWQSDGVVAVAMEPKSSSTNESPGDYLESEASLQELACPCAPAAEKAACSAYW